MSKALSRVRALVTEIDAIQSEGRKTHSIPLMEAVQEVRSEQVSQSQPVTEPVNNVTQLRPESASEGKVFMQLTGKIAVQLQLEQSDEIVEVRQIGDTIEIRFNDGKAVHLPLKSVA